MKIYYYLIIAVGIMLLFGLAGIPTSSNHLLRTFLNNDTQHSVITPDTTASAPSGISAITSFSGSIWELVLIGLLAIAILTLASNISIGGFSLGGGIDSTTVKSAMMFVLFGYIVQDMWSIVAYFFTLGVDWISWTVTLLIALFVTGFAISVIEFVGGSD